MMMVVALVERFKKTSVLLIVYNPSWSPVNACTRYTFPPPLPFRARVDEMTLNCAHPARGRNEFRTQSPKCSITEGEPRTKGSRTAERPRDPSRSEVAPK